MGFIKTFDQYQRWKSMVITQKTNLRTGVTRKQSTPNFTKNEQILTPHTHTSVSISGDKKWLFFGKFGVLCFLVTPVLRFALWPYCPRNSFSLAGSQVDQVPKFQ